MRHHDEKHNESSSGSSGSSGNSGENEKKQMSLKITIPKGVKPGNKINVNLPDGRKLSITVPKGMRPGNVMTVNYKQAPPPVAPVVEPSHAASRVTPHAKPASYPEKPRTLVTNNWLA